MERKKDRCTTIKVAGREIRKEHWLKCKTVQNLAEQKDFFDSRLYDLKLERVVLSEVTSRLIIRGV
jgi:hypothetical protein